MPRIYNCNNHPFDFCKDCFPDEEDFDEGENNGYNAEHPPYEGEEYDCEYTMETIMTKYPRPTSILSGKTTGTNGIKKG